MHEQPRESTDDPSFSAQQSDTREMVLLREYLSLAAVADEPELQEALQRTRRLGWKFALASGQMSKTSVEFGIAQNLNGFYEWKPLHVGGMGAVFRARQSVTGRIVALKMIAPHRLGNAEAQRRFQREVALGQRLQHPHLVEVLGAGEFSGHSFLVMEFLDGRDLGRIAEERGPLAVADACEMIRQAALGTDFLASQGLVHRDLKPSNLMLSGRPAIVKILDLGLACDPDSTSPSDLTESQHILGSYDYLAPDQARDPRTVDRRADVYSLGCALYRLLAGQAPFSHHGMNSPAAKLIAHQLDSAPPLDSLRDDIPRTLAALVARTMAKRPDARFATAGDFAEALALYCAGACLERLLEPSIVTRAHKGQESDAIDQTSPPILPVATQPIACGSDLPRKHTRRFTYRWGLISLAAIAPLTLLATHELFDDRQILVLETGDRQNRGPVMPQWPFTSEVATAAQQAWADKLELSDPEFVNSLGMRLRLIPPPGYFLRDRHSTVPVETPFFMGVNEVGAEEFAMLMRRVSESRGEARPTPFAQVASPPSRLPAQGVGWRDAIEFCRRLSDLPTERRAGRWYTLPTHDEWAWACRAGGDDNVPWDAMTVRDYVVANEPGPRAMGSLPANAFGLFDMRGNVAEWGADWFPEPPGLTTHAANVALAPTRLEDTRVAAETPFLVPALLRRQL
jgi:serine/threonine protein kinase/formylglycine-generating enzyme required for sulfatase activity